MDDAATTRHRETAGATPVEPMYFAWNDALSRNDADTLLSPYAEDCVFESPLVPHLLGTESVRLDGHKELRPLFDMLAERRRPPYTRFLCNCKFRCTVPVHLVQVDVVVFHSVKSGAASCWGAGGLQASAREV